MVTIYRALIWEIVARGKWVLTGFFAVGACLPALIYAGLRKDGVQLDENSWPNLLMHLSIFPIAILCFLVGLVLAIGRPARLYKYPVSTAFIVLWQLVAGGLLLSLLVAVLTLGLNTLLDARWPVLGLLLVSFVGWAACELTRIHSLHIAVRPLPAILLCVWFVMRYGEPFRVPSRMWYQVTAAEIGTLTAAWLVLFAILCHAISKDRSGQAPGIFFLGWLADQWERSSLLRAQKRLQPDKFQFRNHGQAQRWILWRERGYLLPMLQLCMLATFLIGFLIASLGSNLTFQDAINGCAVMGWYSIPLAMIAGMLFVDIGSPHLGKRGQDEGSHLIHSRRSTLGELQSTLPITDRQMAAAWLQTIAQSIGLACVLWIVPMAILDLAHGLTSSIESIVLWKFPNILYPVLIVLLSWALMANLTISALWSLRRTTIGFLVFIAVAAIVPPWRYLSTELGGLCLQLATIACVLGSLVLFSIAYSRRLITNGSLLLAVALGGLTAACVALCWPGESRVWLTTACIWAGCLVAWPIGAMPLVIVNNRHR